MKIASLFTVLALGVAAAAWADERAKSADEKLSDKTFVQKAAIGGMFEVQSSELAQTMSNNADVKQFANRMMTDHTKANQELTRLARQKNWQVPSVLDEKHQAMIDRLRRINNVTNGAPREPLRSGLCGHAVGGPRKNGRHVRKSDAGSQGCRPEGVGNEDAADAEGARRMVKHLNETLNTAGSTATTRPAGRTPPR